MTQQYPYLSKEKSERLWELIQIGYPMSYVESNEYREMCALMDENIAKEIEIYGEPKHAPFDGHCRRCGRSFDDPVPEVTHSEGIHEIACVEWCAECNAFAMSIVFRESSAYRVAKGSLRDPMQGGREDAG